MIHSAYMEIALHNNCRSTLKFTDFLIRSSNKRSQWDCCASRICWLHKKFPCNNG